MKRAYLLLLPALLLIVSCSPSTATPGSPSTPGSPGTSSSLSEDLLKNAEYFFVEEGQPYSIRLTDGSYQFGSDPLSDDYFAVRLADVFAYGDLDGDGLEDAVVLLTETYGTTDGLVSLAVVLNQDGVPHHVSTAFLDIYPSIYTLEIVEGEIQIDAILHTLSDPVCCPTQPQTRTYLFGPRGLVLARIAVRDEDDQEHNLSIESPAQADLVNSTFTLSGSISITPAERKLWVEVYDSAETRVFSDSLQVTAEQTGGPGTFETIIDLTGLEVEPGPLRIVVMDIDIVDGGYLALAAVSVTLK